MNIYDTEPETWTDLRIVAQDEARCQTLLRVQQCCSCQGSLFKHGVRLGSPEGGLIVRTQLMECAHMA
jgi:hypothetical protein